MIIAMEYAAGGTLLELLDARVKIWIWKIIKIISTFFIYVTKIEQSVSSDKIKEIILLITQKGMTWSFQ
jgi:hypothetical protein